MRIGIDLLWVRHNKVGGTESYVRNLLKGFMMLEDDFKIFLILSEDNKDFFEEFLKDSRFNKILCNIKSANVAKRIIWENLYLCKILKNNDIKICFEPVYSKPIFCFKNIKFVTTIHDIQAWHYPEYQSKFRVMWLKFNWYNSVRTSDKVIAISEFVRKDIITRYGYPEKVTTIYNPVDINKNDMVSFDGIFEKYNIIENEFYYTVSSLAPHKNLITIVKVIKAIKDRKYDLPSKLLISGIGGHAGEKILSYIKENNLDGNIILTGFIGNSERNTLYKSCRAFLFPSVFEGFGMPPVEAMAFSEQVITTNKTSIYEVTQGKATYVENPFDVEEWIGAMINFAKKDSSIDLERYDLKYIAKKYLDCLSN